MAEGNKKLSEVVKECHAQWYVETAIEAESGKATMQLLLSQMYYNGYGVKKDPEIGKYWMQKAATRIGSSEAVCEKTPGYSFSDKDSDEPTNVS